MPRLGAIAATPYRRGVLALAVVTALWRAWTVSRWSWQDDDWVYLADAARLATRVRRTRMREHGDTPADASLYGAFVALGKLAEAQGVTEALWKHWLGHNMQYVEYKDYQRA